MDSYASIFAEVWQRTGAVYPKLSYGAVFVLAGLVGCFFWWTVGRAYDQQEKTASELSTLMQQVKALQERPPVINVNVPPAQVQIAPASASAPAPKPYPVLGVTKTTVAVETTATPQIKYFVAIGNTGTVETRATFAVEMLINDAWKAVQEPRVMVVPRDRQWEYRNTFPLPGSSEAEFSAGRLKLHIRVTAVYDDRGTAKTYTFEGAFKPGIEYLDVVTSDVR